MCTTQSHHLLKVFVTIIAIVVLTFDDDSSVEAWGVYTSTKAKEKAPGVSGSQAHGLAQ